MNKGKNEQAKKCTHQTQDWRVGLLSHKFWYRFIHQIFPEYVLCVRNCSGVIALNKIKFVD